VNAISFHLGLSLSATLHFALGRLLHFPTFEKFEHFCLHKKKSTHLKVPPSTCVLTRGIPRDRRRRRTMQEMRMAIPAAFFALIEGEVELALADVSGC
jgi:hypothetical protein